MTEGRDRAIEQSMLGLSLVALALVPALVLVLVVVVLGRSGGSLDVVWPLLANSLAIGALALLVALPLGLLGAIYLAEFASAKVRAFMIPTLGLLAAIPSVVFGYFALWLPSMPFVRWSSASLAIGLMLVPMVTSLGDAALRAVPLRLREAAWSLGADPLTTITSALLPAAAWNLGSAALLASVRAIGETIIVLVIAVPTLSAGIVDLRLREDAFEGLADGQIFTLGACLLVSTLVIDRGARALARRARVEAGGEA